MKTDPCHVAVAIRQPVFYNELMSGYDCGWDNQNRNIDSLVRYMSVYYMREDFEMSFVSPVSTNLMAARMMEEIGVMRKHPRLVTRNHIVLHWRECRMKMIFGDSYHLALHDYGTEYVLNDLMAPPPSALIEAGSYHD